MTIASLIIDVAANTAQVVKDVEKVQGSLSRAESIAGSMAKAFAGAFTVGAVVAFATEIAAFASEIQDLSEQTTISTTRLQALNLVGSDVGITVQDMTRAVSALSKRLVGGDDSAVAAVKYLGLNLDEIIGMAPDEALIKIVEAASRIANPMERNAIMSELFGEKLVKLIRLGGDFGKMVDEAAKGKGIIPPETIALAAAADDAMHRAWITTKAWAATLTGELVGAVRAANDAFVEITTIGFRRAAEEAAKAREGALALAVSHDRVTSSLPPLTQSYADFVRQQKASTEAAKQHEKDLEKAAKAYDQYVKADLAKNERMLNADREANAALQASADAAIRDRIAKADAAALQMMAISAREAAYALETQRDTNRQAAALREELALGQMQADLDEMDRLAAKRDQTLSELEAIGARYVYLGMQAQASAGATMTAVGAMFTGYTEFLRLQQESTALGVEMSTTNLLTTAGTVFGTLGRKYKAFAIAEALIATYLSVAKTLATTPWPINLILAAGALASGLANVAMIRKQDQPGFATGTHGQYLDFGAGQAVMLHGRERVMTEQEGRAEQGGWALMAAELTGLRRDMQRQQALLPVLVQSQMLLSRA